MFQIDRASAANVRRSNEEIANDTEKEDIFGYTGGKLHMTRNCFEMVNVVEDLFVKQFFHAANEPSDFLKLRKLGL